MCKEVNIINLCSRFNPNRLGCRCIHRSLFLRMLKLLVGVRSHNRNIGICRHRNAHKYIPNIRLVRPYIII